MLIHRWIYCSCMIIKFGSITPKITMDQSSLCYTNNGKDKRFKKIISSFGALNEDENLFQS